jgi:hypothetical protein
MDLAEKAYRFIYEVQKGYTKMHTDMLKMQETRRSELEVVLLTSNKVTHLTQQIVTLRETLESMQQDKAFTNNLEESMKTVANLTTRLTQKTRELHDNLQTFSSTVDLMKQTMENQYEYFKGLQTTHLNPLVKGINAGLLGQKEYKQYLLRLQETISASLDKRIQWHANEFTNSYSSSDYSSRTIEKTSVYAELSQRILNVIDAQELPEIKQKAYVAHVNKQLTKDKSAQSLSTLDKQTASKYLTDSSNNTNKEPNAKALPIINKEDVEKMNRLSPTNKLQPMNPGLSRSSSTDSISSQGSTGSNKLEIITKKAITGLAAVVNQGRASMVVKSYTVPGSTSTMDSASLDTASSPRNVILD